MTNKLTVERQQSEWANSSIATPPTDDQEAVIVADNLSKHFGATKALDSILQNSAVRRSSLIGSNGAGKSTFL